MIIFNLKKKEKLISSRENGLLNFYEPMSEIVMLIEKKMPCPFRT